MAAAGCTCLQQGQRAWRWLSALPVGNGMQEEDGRAGRKRLRASAFIDDIAGKLPLLSRGCSSRQARGGQPVAPLRARLPGLPPALACRVTLAQPAPMPCCRGGR